MNKKQKQNFIIEIDKLHFDRTNYKHTVIALLKIIAKILIYK